MVDKVPVDDEMSFLASIAGGLLPALGLSLKEIEVKESDKVVAALLVRYAMEIDKGNLSTVARIGPLFLQACEALQMSPRARAQASKGSVPSGQPAAPKSKLDELRIKRLERKNGTQAIHSASS